MLQSFDLKTRDDDWEQGALLQHMPMLTIGGVPLVPERAELRRLLCTPSCVGSVLFTFAVSVCIVLSPAWRESLRLQRIEQEQQAKLYGTTGVERPDVRAASPQHSPTRPGAPVGLEEVEEAGGVLTAVLYHDVPHHSKSPREKQEPLSVRSCQQLTFFTIISQVSRTFEPLLEAQIDKMLLLLMPWLLVSLELRRDSCQASV